MIDEQDLFERFHAAFDREAPPGAFDRLSAALTNRTRQARSPRDFPYWLRVGLKPAVAVLLLVLVVGLVGAFLNSRLAVRLVPSHPHPTSPPQSRVFATPWPGYAVYQLFPEKMVSPTVGWASGGFRTTDGGANWRDVSPPLLDGSVDRFPEFYLDSNHAWQGQEFADHVVIFRTTDSGRTWQQGAPVTVKVTNSQHGFGSYLDFVDSNRGWLMTQSWWEGDPHPDPAASALYLTLDGGLHWTLQSTGPGLAAPGCYFSQGMTFVSTSIGWVELFCPAGRPAASRLLITRDGGLTWQIEGLGGQGLCQPCTSDLPLVLDSQHWMVQAGGILFTTGDAGGTWNARTLPPGRRPLLSFINPALGWAFGAQDSKDPALRSPQLYQTNDGGQTWHPESSNVGGLAPDASIDGLVFVDAKHGFASHRLGTAEVVLLSTADGGATWTVVDKQIVGNGGSVPPTP